MQGTLRFVAALSNFRFYQPRGGTFPGAVAVKLRDTGRGPVAQLDLVEDVLAVRQDAAPPVLRRPVPNGHVLVYADGSACLEGTRTRDGLTYCPGLHGWLGDGGPVHLDPTYPDDRKRETHA